LTIDGLQPEKGHETLYAVRELTQKRVWFAEALMSATEDEVRRLIAQAKQWAEQLGKRVVLWMSDKQDAFVKGIAVEFPGVAHRYCDNHFLRDVAKPVLDADSHAKVKMRKKVRGLRGIEQSVLKERRRTAEPESQALPESSIVIETAHLDDTPVAEEEPAGDVVLAYCARCGHSQRRSGWTASSAWFADGPSAHRGAAVDPTKLGREKGVRRKATRPLGRLH
jgi:hypothetical protein